MVDNKHNWILQINEEIKWPIFTDSDFVYVIDIISYKLLRRIWKIYVDSYCVRVLRKELAI